MITHPKDAIARAVSFLRGCTPSRIPADWSMTPDNVCTDWRPAPDEPRRKVWRVGVKVRVSGDFVRAVGRPGRVALAFAGTGILRDEPPHHIVWTVEVADIDDPVFDDEVAVAAAGPIISAWAREPLPEAA